PRTDLEQVVVVGRPSESGVGLDHRQPHAVLLQLAIGEAAPAEQVRASDLEPGEVLRVVGDAHLVGLRVAHPDLRGGLDAQRQASSSRRAAASASPAPKTAVPATSTSAPASTSARALLMSTPPSISISVRSPRSRARCLRRRTLSRPDGRNCWPPKPGLTVITTT